MPSSADRAAPSLLGDDKELAGEVSGVLFSDPDTGYGVVLLDAGTDGYHRATGPLSDLVEGQRVRLVGGWTDHPKHGETFAATMYEQLVPTTKAGLRNFLLSDRFDVSPGIVEDVLDAFGRKAGGIIAAGSQALVDAGIDPDAARRLHRDWVAGQALGDLVLAFERAGVPADVARSVHARFGPEAVELAETRPYELLDADRMRFAHADALAKAAGMQATDPGRLAAGARAAVRAAMRSDGHQALPRQQVVEASARLLKVDAIAAAAGLDDAVAAGVLVAEELPTADGKAVLVFTEAAHRHERQLAEHLLRLRDASGRLEHLAAELELDDELTDGQRDGVRRAFAQTVSVLTGGPGTGKTRTIVEVVRIAEAADANIALCAPTGRAAKRIEEVTGRAATTVHRLLDARPMDGGGFVFARDEDDPVPYDLVVADEVSMCDTRLAASLVRAIEDGAHLVLVGDPDQLPSVGPGDVLRDVLASEAFEHTALTEVHRQAKGSRIVTLAQEVNAGSVGPVAGADVDVFLAEDDHPGRIVARVVNAVAERAPGLFDVTPDEVQVLAPVYRGSVGVHALNEALKERLNPARDRKDLAGFHEGDRVMQTRNDPDREVSNGDIGTVADVNLTKGLLKVQFPSGLVEVDRKQANDLTHAWCVTVHKSQGGEWPVVVLVCDRSHGGMLWQNLVYTAITRAQRALIIVGQHDALARAARQDRPRNRTTGLRSRLTSG